MNPQGLLEQVAWKAGTAGSEGPRHSNAPGLPDESEFAALRYFALGGTDHRSHTEQNAALGAYLRWHNRHAHPKRGFAPNSRIRHPDYTANTA